MSISSSSMLVELNISVWTANKIDKRATDTVLSDNNAGSSDAGQFRKNLMAGSTLRKEIADFAASCRLWHNNITLPWSDRGPRLLPTSLFFDYKTEADKRRAKFEHMVEIFKAEYPTLKAAAPTFLGSLYDPSDYPSVGELDGKFGFRMVFTPLPQAGDFRIDVAAEDLDILRNQYEDSLNARLAEAMQSQWTRLHDMLTRMADKLASQPEGDDTKRRWHDTFLTNAEDLCEMLTHLNVTKDPELERARLALKNAIRDVDMEDIKKDELTRLDVKSKLDTILKAYEW